MCPAPLAAFGRTRGKTPADHQDGPQALDGERGKKKETVLPLTQEACVQGIRPRERTTRVLTEAGRGVRR